MKNQFIPVLCMDEYTSYTNHTYMHTPHVSVVFFVKRQRDKNKSNYHIRLIAKHNGL